MNPQPQIIGLGFGLAVLDGAVTIVYVVPDTPATRAGLSAGIVVQTIDGTSTVGMQPKDWLQKLRGEVGTKVQLEIREPASARSSVLELTREQFVLPEMLPT